MRRPDAVSSRFCLPAITKKNLKHEGSCLFGTSMNLKPLDFPCAASIRQLAFERNRFFLRVEVFF